MEHPESDYEADQERRKGDRERPEHLEGLCRTVVDSIREKSGEHDKYTIEQQYTPIRERPPGEIPVGYRFKGFHKNIDELLQLPYT